MLYALCRRTLLMIFVATLGLAVVGCLGSGGGGSADAGDIDADTGNGGDQDTGGDQNNGDDQDTGGDQGQTLSGELIYESDCLICGPSIAERPVGDRIVFSHRTESDTTLGYTWSEAGGLEQLYESADGYALSVSYTADRVLFRTEGDPDTQRIMLYDRGEITDMGQSSPNHSLAVGETVAAWLVPYRTIRVYDFEAGDYADIANIEDVNGTILATANAIILKKPNSPAAVWYRGSTEFTFPSGLGYPMENTLSWEEDVAAWVTMEKVVKRYDAASGDLVSFGENASPNYDPLVDGPRVLWFKDDPDSPYFGGELRVWEDGQDRLVAAIEGSYSCVTINDGVVWRRQAEGLVRYDPSGSTTAFELSPSPGGPCALSRTHVFWVDENADLYVSPLP